MTRVHSWKNGVKEASRSGVLIVVLMTSEAPAYLLASIWAFGGLLVKPDMDSSKET